MKKPRISIITVSFNSASTIRDTIDSVLAQSYTDLEYIIVDGRSKDGTVEIVKSYGKKISQFISETDLGIYDAINKGIRISSGDIIGILNSDDSFYNEYVVENIEKAFDDARTEVVIGDVQFFDPAKSSRILRYYSSKKWNPGKFKFGYMPAHPSFYARRELFEKFGIYKTDYTIAADYELMIRFLFVNKVKYSYIEMPFVNMRAGGVSNRSIHSRYLLNKEILRACKENGINTNYLNIYSKYFIKFFEYVGNNRKP